MLGIIVGLIFLGIILILIEVLVIPGTSVAGFLGMFLMAVGVYLAYTKISITTGHYTLGASLIASVILIIFALRPRTWKKAMLTASVDGKVVNIETEESLIGKEGITITRLNPIGKVKVDDKYYEAKSWYTIIEPNTQVEIIRIESNLLIVKPKLK